MRHDVDSDEIEKAEDAGPRHSECRHDGIGLFRRQALAEGFERRQGQPVATDAVGDESRCVTAVDHRLAENDLKRGANTVDAFGIVLRRGHELHQLHLAGWIEKMGNDEIRCECCRHTADQRRSRNG